MKYRILSILLLIITAFNLCSCDSEKESYVFKSVIYGNPKTLDPQCALRDSSYSVIYNVFQGLFTYDEQGNIVNGMIERYNVSDDGLIWTFYLKKDVKWSDGDEFVADCTADDFVFAFKRLLKPLTKSKRAGEYFIIKNAEAINNGEIDDISELGVEALNSYTLEITLEMPCSDFKALLTLPPSMPCNEEYYNSTQGRYGLAADYIASNSNYFVHTWSYDEWSNENNYFILRRNTLNNSAYNLPSGINFFINPVDERKDFDDVIHTYTGYSESEIPELMKKYRFSEHNSETYGLIFNLAESFSKLEYRRELGFYAVDNNEYGIVPECAAIGNYNYRQLAGKPQRNFISHSSSVGMISNARMIIPVNTSVSDDITDLLQKWQSECGFYCSIAELDTSDYSKALSNGDFDIALISLSGEYNSPYAYLNDFLEGNSQNYSGYSNSKFNHIMNSAYTANDEKTASLFYKEAEQLLLDSAVFIPLAVNNKYVFYSDKADNVWYNPYLDIFCFRQSENKVEE